MGRPPGHAPIFSFLFFFSSSSWSFRLPDMAGLITLLVHDGSTEGVLVPEESPRTVSFDGRCVPADIGPPSIEAQMDGGRHGSASGSHRDPAAARFASRRTYASQAQEPNGGGRRRPQICTRSILLGAKTQRITTRRNRRGERQEFPESIVPSTSKKSAKLFQVRERSKQPRGPPIVR